MSVDGIIRDTYFRGWGMKSASLHRDNHIGRKEEDEAVEKAVKDLRTLVEQICEELIGEDGELNDCKHGGFDHDSYCIRGQNELRASQRANIPKILDSLFNTSKEKSNG